MKREILNSHIPLGGRNLTSSECRKLRGMNVSCSEAWRIMPNGDENVGYLFYPAGIKIWNAADIRVSWRGW